MQKVELVWTVFLYFLRCVSFVIEPGARVECVVWSGGGPCGGQRYCSSSRTLAALVESVRRSSADWRDVTPEQDALLQQHTIQTEHRRKKSWTRRGKLTCLIFLTSRTLSAGFWNVRCVWIPACTLVWEQRYLDGVCTHRNFIQAFVSGMLAS